MEEVTRKIAEFILKTKFDAVARDALEMAKIHILDTVGCILAGSQEEAANIIATYLCDIDGGGTSTIIPSGMRTTAPYAALANGVSGHVLDYDDYEWPSMAHPSVTVLPAVFALGEKTHASGKDCLEAYLIGIEVISKIGTGINPNHYDKGWHSTSTLGTLGAASASSKLLELDAEKTRMAIGIAASLSSGLRGNFGTMTKAFHAGHASRSGVESSLLSSLGYTATKDILEAELGFCNLFTDPKEYDLEKITADLGAPFSIVSPGVGKKLYPSCAATHSTLDGVLYLAEKFDIKAADVDSVECGIYYLYPKMLIHSNPQTGLEGKFSLEFCAALGLHERAARLAHFTDSKVQEPQIQELIKRVHKYVTEEVGTRGTAYPAAIIKVNLKNGKSYSYKVENRKGSPANPLSADEIVHKFMDCACLVHSRPQAHRIVDAVMNMENLDDIGTLTILLQKPE